MGISSGASAPENLVAELVEFFRARGVQDISEVDVIREDVRFMLPKQVREAVRARARRPGLLSAAPAGADGRSVAPVAMRTLIVSDLHLGSLSGADVLRRPELRAALLEALEDVDRLVLLGDVLELRHGPPREAMAAARPFFEDLGAALAGRELVSPPATTTICSSTVAGARALRREPAPLGARAALLEPAQASPMLEQIAEWAPRRACSVAYPGPVGAPRRVCHPRPLPRLPSDGAHARAPRASG